MEWMDDGKGDEEPPSWPSQNKDEMDLEMGMGMNMGMGMGLGGPLSSFKSLLEVGEDENQEWFLNNNGGVVVAAANDNNNTNMLELEHQSISFPTNFNSVVDHHNNLFMQAVDSSASASSSPSPATIFSNLDPSQVHFFLPPKTTMAMANNPLEGGFDLGCENGFLENQNLSNYNNRVVNNNAPFNGGFCDLVAAPPQLNVPNFSSNSQFLSSNMVQFPQESGGFGVFGFGGAAGNAGNAGNESASMFLNRSKTLKPLDNFGSVGKQPTLFQKRAALRKNLANNGENSNSAAFGGEIGRICNNVEGFEKNKNIIETNGKKRKLINVDDMDDMSLDASNLNYDSDDLLEISGSKGEESGKNGGTSSNPNSNVTGVDPKGKKKGLPAKNLMAERRRRKKLNDRLYMLRSVVPKISKMDRASILGDAIDYLKELLQQINDLHNELESAPAGSSLTPAANFYPLTPTGASLPSHIKEELCPNAFPSPLSSPTGQPARVEVRLREGRAVNVHMFCNRKPGILLSTMRALETLGLDIQQAVISCFNGFALDIFRAEQCKDGQEVPPEHIKAILLESAGYHGMV